MFLQRVLLLVLLLSVYGVESGCFRIFRRRKCVKNSDYSECIDYCSKKYTEPNEYVTCAHGCDKLLKPRENQKIKNQKKPLKNSGTISECIDYCSNQAKANANFDVDTCVRGCDKLLGTKRPRE